jgi:hypothetical protein
MDGGWRGVTFASRKISHVADGLDIRYAVEPDVGLLLQATVRHFTKGIREGERF